MRVAIGGKGWLATRAARYIEALGPLLRIDLTVEVVRNRDDAGHDTWMPSLVGLASARGWRTHETVKSAKLGRGDVFLSLQYDRIVSCSALGGARAYNLHFAHLSRYRGSLTSAWSVRNGDPTAGVTLHVLTEVLDGGPVIASRTFDVPRFYSTYDLYLACHAHGFELLTEHVEDLLRGTCEAVPQDVDQAMVLTRRSIDFSDLELREFEASAEEIRDRCRSLIFPPRNLPTFRGRPIQECCSIDHDAGDMAPGTVLATGPDYALVACGVGLIWLEFAR